MFNVVNKHICALLIERACLAEWLLAVPAQKQVFDEIG
jgi:hypothetical protein